MPACPRRSLAVSLTVCSALVTGCGSNGAPKLEDADGAALIALAHRIASEGACAQARDIPRLRTRAIALINAGKVPPELQEPLMSGVGALSAEQPLCLPAVTPHHHHHDGTVTGTRPQARPRPRRPRAGRRGMSEYRVDHELGRGGMAIVYAGYQHGLDRPVALKVLAEHLADNAEFRARFLREARIAAKLHHPHLVRTFDVTEVEGRPCIVMELLLPQTLEGRRLTRTEAAQVAQGLAYAHRQGVVHRDLKPANLLRSPSGEVKIADFGIARAAEETMLTQAGTVLGTLRYLAPEQAEGFPVGPPADVYSLGVVLQELLDEADQALVAWCLRRDPDDRPTAAEVAAALESPPTVVRTGVRHRKMSVTLPWLAAAGLAATVAATALIALRHDTKPADVKPVPHATTPAHEARNLEAWLRRYSR